MARRPLPPAREIGTALLGLGGLLVVLVLTALVLQATLGPGPVARLPLTLMPVLLVAYVLLLGRRR